MILLQFGKAMLVDLAVHVEVLALREGLLVAAASHWTSSHSFSF